MEFKTSAQLRVITAGSVDDGKSTLIGRLLFDTKNVFRDQISSIGKSKFNRTVTESIDLSLLTDGLEAEREQGITIDVAYRYFSTANRKFILGDCPGHEAYTRNMVTATSTADVAIVLVDVSKLDFSSLSNVLLLPQTRRHSNICQMMGTEHILVAVNKMDLIDFNQEKYLAVQSAYLKLANEIGLTKNLHFIPISALKGTNVIQTSNLTPWYEGPCLLDILEKIELSTEQTLKDFRFPVQLVSRSSGDTINAFRGYMGRVSSGRLKVGDEIKVYPSGNSAVVKSIIYSNENINSAQAGDSICTVLDREIDVSRGDMFYHAKDSVHANNLLSARLCWFSETPLNKNHQVLLKIGCQTLKARFDGEIISFDVHTNKAHDTDSLNLNDIGNVSLRLQKSLIVDRYTEFPETGAFILIDEISNETIAAGMIT